MAAEGAASPVRVGNTEPGASTSSRKSLRSPKTINGVRVIRRVFLPGER